jgi:hypothetical protein
VLILLCSSVLSINAYSDTESSAVTNTQHFLQDLSQKNPGYKFNSSLPVNVYDKNITLNIKIPKELKLSYEDPGNPHFMQFKDKSTLITTSNQTGGKFQANTSLKQVIKAMQANSQITILQSEDHEYLEYSDGYRIVKLYYSKENTTDVVYVYAISGPYDSASVIYTIHTQADDKIDDVVKKLKNSFDSIVKTVVGTEN